MGLFFENRQDAGYSMAIWKTEESLDELCEMAGLDVNALPARSASRRIEWIAARLLLKDLLGSRKMPDVAYDEYGKPSLPGTGLSVSISHSKAFVGAILTKQATCGIDLEMIHPRIEKLAGRFLSDEERQFIQPEHRLGSLYVIWGVKEVLYKIHGKKDIIFRDDMRTEPFSFTGEGVVTGHLRKANHALTVAVKYRQLGDVMLSYAIS